jgi:protein-tyrosine-phosphatase
MSEGIYIRYPHSVSYNNTNFFYIIKHNVPISHEAQQVKTADFTRFTHILASDNQNLRELERIKPKNATAEVRLWGSYLDDKPIPDPYYGSMVNCNTYMFHINANVLHLERV